jgi:hypothetical protein
MSAKQRIALIAVALIVAVLAFVLAQPGDDEDDGERATAPAQTETESGSGGSTAPAETEEPPPPPEPEVTRLRLRGVESGDTVRIVVISDASDEIHLHGYDITRNPAPGRPARFRFKADAEGSFEIESHVAEDAGKDPLVARLVVQPS